MIKTKRTDSQDPAFIELVRQLDSVLADLDGAEHSFYARFNKTDKIKHALVLYADELAVSCGAFREYNPRTVEIKRMYTLPSYRGNGFAVRILMELEQWAAELNYERCILETGKRQPDAIRLYERNGYKPIPNFDQYIGVENSLCFAKNIRRHTKADLTSK